MKYLSEFVSNNLASERIERKFIMSKGQAISARGALYANGFKESYKSRMISSVYFDTPDFNSLRDNIDGVPSRDKVRLRFYDSQIETSVMETKHKRADRGYKNVYNLKTNARSFFEVVDEANNWCRTNLLDILEPSALISYRRTYYLKDNFRATIDTEINGKRMVSKTFVSSAMKDYSVVEFKYKLNLDGIFRSNKLFFGVGMRNTKCSKYANALMY